MSEDIKIRKAIEADADAIWELIYELAVFERAESEHVLSATQIARDIEQNLFIAFIAEISDMAVGMALCYPVYSTWKGASFYLEDLIVKQTFRQRGIGSLLFEHVVKYANETGAGRLSWQVLNWNEPAIAFYEKYNAVLDDEWITCRLTKEQLQQLDKRA